MFQTQFLTAFGAAKGIQLGQLYSALLSTASCMFWNVGCKIHLAIHSLVNAEILIDG
jgi:hypothetical protein